MRVQADAHIWLWGAVMRILELTAHVKVISRAKGRSATAAAAYRACAVIACEREGKVHDYTRKAGLEASAIVLPDVAPGWALNSSRLWNAAELRERNGARGANAGAWKADATTAREVMFGYPAELSPAGRLAFAERIARHMVEAHGVAVEWANHAPGKLGDQRNHHCHMLFTTRRMTADGLGEKTREWDSRSAGRRTVYAFRAMLAAAMNEALAGEGHGAAVFVEHRSLKKRGSDRIATKHLPRGQVNAERKRKARERQAWEKQHRTGQAERQRQERDEHAKERLVRSDLARRDIDGREARAIERERAKAPPEPVKPQPGRLQRIFQAVTGRADRAPEPQTPGRAEQERSIGEVRAIFQAERARMADGQQRDAKALDDRHRAEDQQLDRAASSRVARDLAEEVQHRRDLAEARVQERGHDHDRGHERGHEKHRDLDDRERRMTP